MPEEVRLWRIEGEDKLREYQRGSLKLESRLEAWLAEDISLLSPDLTVIGRQVETTFGGFIDLLCIDRAGDIVIVELKRDKTPREVTAQTLEYASFVKDLSGDRITQIADRYLGGEGSLEAAFKRRFDTDLPDSLNENHRMVVIASEIDPSSERIIKYLSDTHGVDINAATFQYFRAPDGSEFVARVFLIEPTQVKYKTQTKGSSTRLPNLTYAQLEEIASNNGVGDLYRRLVAALEQYTQTGTTRSSIGFTGNFDGSRKTIFSLLPRESSRESGLRFQVYFGRFQTYFGLSEDGALALLPEKREHWKYYPGAGPDYSGFAGCFLNGEEADRFLEGLARSQKK
jgi:hypothetical protein